jgi:hypothetical protein
MTGKTHCTWSLREPLVAAKRCAWQFGLALEQSAESSFASKLERVSRRYKGRALVIQSAR